MGRYPTLRILHLEDSPADAKLVVHALRARFQVTAQRVETEYGFLKSLDEGEWDLILADYNLPTFDGLKALAAVQQRGLDIPFILISGTIGEELAVSAMKAGAHDYIMKTSLSRLAPAVERELRESDTRLRGKHAEAIARKSEARLQVLLESSDDIVLELDGGGVCTGVWGNSERLLGLSKTALLNKSLEVTFFKLANELPTQDMRISSLLSSRQDIEFSIAVQGDRRHLQARLSAVKEQDQSLSTYCVVLRDVTDSKEAQERILYLAHYDTLTALPNRTLLLDRLELAIAKSCRSRSLLAVLMLDLDRLKIVNESLGRAVGDAILQEVASRIRQELRSEDTLARLSGDEFVVVLPDLDNPDLAAITADKILQAVARPLRIGEQDTVITLSIGISLYPQDGDNAESLLRNADSAMYFAKQTGRNSYQFFAAEMNAHVAERLSLEHALRLAVERNELRLQYQPQIDIATGDIIGAEALIRWQHPQFGLLSPAKFITIAEESGLIIPIGRWVLQEACFQAVAWHKAGLPVFPVSVNVSALQFRKKGFLKTVQDVLECAQLAPEYLELELTESIIMGQDNSSTLLHEFRALGVKLAIDDFGTGYSSLSYLKRFPIDKLKIDKSFVLDVASDPEAAAITAAIISLAKHLNLRVIAEGVEKKAELDFLRANGCDEAQGFYFSKPVSAAALFSLKLAQGLRLDAVPAD